MTQFYGHSSPDLSSTIPREDGHERAETLHQYRLDTFCRTHGGIKPDALIIDTEGTTLDVLEGCGTLLDNMKVIYAECQTSDPRPSVRHVNDVDALLVAHGMTQHTKEPSYARWQTQGNFTWVRK